MPADVYVPDPRRVSRARWLAGLLGIMVLLSVLPAARHLNLETAPGWARVALLAAALQAIYVGWLAAAPDWASLWIVMFVFAAVATLYALAAALAYATPRHQGVLLGLDAIRTAAAAWCSAVVAMMTLGTYLCGRVSARWRRVVQTQVTSSIATPRA
jgi:hypothetical protein